MFKRSCPCGICEVWAGRLHGQVDLDFEEWLGQFSKQGMWVVPQGHRDQTAFPPARAAEEGITEHQKRELESLPTQGRLCW